MRRAGDADQAEAIGDGHVGGGGEGAADVDARDGDGVDDGASGERAGGGVEVGRVEDLGVVVICRAGAAEAAAAVHDGAVEHEEGGGVVGAWDGHGGELGEGVGGGVEEFGGLLGGVVGEGVTVYLAASDEDGAVGQDDAVGENTLVGRAADCGDLGYSRRGTDGNDVGVGSGIGVLVID